MTVFAVLGAIHILNFIVGYGPPLWDDYQFGYFSEWSKPGREGDGLDKYPTDFTRDIQPIPCHSHNDYWRRIPLLEAIHYGCTGVEADVWLFDGDLFVGHNTASLSSNRTFRSMYVDPLVQILDRQNPKTDFATPDALHPAGVFDTDADQTLVLLVDFKNSGADIFPVVEAQIAALREKNYLTYFNGEETISGPITVVATGNAPFNLITANSTYRDIFFDAPLDSMYEAPVNSPPSNSKRSSSLLSLFRRDPSPGQGHTGLDRDSEPFSPANSYYASTNFRASIGYLWRGYLSAAQMQKLRGQIQGAKKLGLHSRYWGAPEWPRRTRETVWRVLVEEGVGYLNVDDLKGVARGGWRKGVGGEDGPWA
ncbi:hypothetical protein K402DRAFT_404219 [Aulographum hederae CBS 113979]|uniref:Altered inheritance of mitochondria protein 6 n=1 Tax=Aulographum hederae CBS 113979 TaxID=1176131 RepID=A0A6G1GZX7_9PEZI|nr:hypothetical protein K402DRAFT_404219 [Aulographum hederae CBS 113979]